MTVPNTEPGGLPEESSRSDEQRTVTGRWLTIGAALCAVAIVLFYVGDLLRGERPDPPPAPRADALAAPVPEPTTSEESTSPAALPYSPPTRVRIPALGIDATLGEVGRTPDGNIGAPDPGHADMPAWYRLSVAPGELGTSVIVGHVDSVAGPAVFYELGALEPGDRVLVNRADGEVAEFVVDGIRVHAKAEFPAREVLKPRGRPELRLITCGGPFDRRSGYTDNVIVYAHLVIE